MNNNHPAPPPPPQPTQINFHNPTAMMLYFVLDRSINDANYAINLCRAVGNPALAEFYAKMALQFQAARDQIAREDQGGLVLATSLGRPQ